MKAILISIICVITACSQEQQVNPGGISDANYAQFKELAPPKILFSCELNIERDLLIECFIKDLANPQKCSHLEGKKERYTEQKYIGYVAQLSAMNTYNQMLEDSKDKCNSLEAEFNLLEGIKK